MSRKTSRFSSSKSRFAKVSTDKPKRCWVCNRTPKVLDNALLTNTGIKRKHTLY